jgi:CRP-like cAMP-binding protein
MAKRMSPFTKSLPGRLISKNKVESKSEIQNTLNFLNQFHPLTTDDFELLIKDLPERKAKKGEWLVAPGQVQRELYFVQKGVQMSYYEAEDKLHVIAFTYPPNLCAIPDSFLFQRKSKFYLKCLADSEFLVLSHDRLQQIFDQSRNIETFFRRANEGLLAATIDRHLEFHTLTMEERYRTFCQRSAHLLQIVPHKYIASYLGIDATNFSKLFNTIKI